MSKRDRRRFSRGCKLGVVERMAAGAGTLARDRAMLAASPKRVSAPRGEVMTWTARHYPIPECPAGANGSELQAG